ncbi:MAG: PilX N-terminal domain-containing pilus assembly protein [Acidovorax soli]|uniref:PilX N-terminal domain-containing pilus assembly protein n=1 Tax=Acidovorax soli TaxID=592050 RepID=UPI0026F168FC|nr:PilX N-terminal domain-containing pilus assembly protein [Acidovorax soli]MCM2347226.1 PilX N-terminal domain-containing pilus assembly protein [Acidovorax soli]
MTMMKNPSIFFSLKSQRGAASLIVAVLLLVGMTLVAFFGNRVYIFEQKTSANQFRATKAFEAAEAGLEWAIGQLNDPTVIDAAPSCAAATTGLTTKTSFRVRYAQPEPPNPLATPPKLQGFYPPANSQAACSISAAGALSCNCPAPGTSPTIGSATNARFRVAFNPVASDPLSFEVISTGCTSEDNACDGSTAKADATAIVRALVKVVPTFGNAPSSALTTGSATNITGTLSVVNTDLSTNGITINAGTSVVQGTSTSVVTVPGTPPSASILDNDASLTALTNADANGDLFFQSYFGKTMEAYRNDSQTKVITAADCATASACGALVSSWYNQGFQQFWIYPDVQFTNANLPEAGTLGTAERPIFLAGDGNLELKSNLVAYGMLYAATASATENWDYSGSGSGTVFGALVSRGSFNKGSGTLNIVFDPKVFGLESAPSGVLVRVPGSWRDKYSNY